MQVIFDVYVVRRAYGDDTGGSRRRFGFIAIKLKMRVSIRIIGGRYKRNLQKGNEEKDDDEQQQQQQQEEAVYSSAIVRVRIGNAVPCHLSCAVAEVIKDGFYML